MLAVLVKLIFSVITTISNIITKVIFSTTAYFMVMIIHAFKVPGEATKGMLEQTADIIRAVLEYVLEVIMSVITTILSSIFDTVKDAIVESIVSGSSVLSEIMEQTKSSFEGLLNDVPDIVQGFSEMLTSLISDFVNNSMEAVGIVQENA